MSDAAPTAEQKRAVADRAAECCEYCLSQARYSCDPFSTEHIIPRSAGGSGELSNLCFACQGCNNRKYTSTQAVDPVSGETVPLYHPRRDRWSDHFAWGSDFSEIVGLTPVARATIQKLQLNRPGVVNLRRILSAAGEHPPPAVPAPETG